MPKLTQETIGRFMKIAPAQIGHHINEGFMHPRIKPVAPSFKVLGPAYTVKMTERDGAALNYAIMKAEEGAILVVDRGADPIFACAGDQLIMMMKHRGLGGLVVDGPVTDKIGIEKLGFPVFCTGFSAVTTVITGTSGAVDIPIQCGGTVVKPGALIFGDTDGVIIVPDDYEELLALGESMTADEIRRMERVEKEGYKYMRHDNFDIVKFYEYNIGSAINQIKEGHCKP